MGKERTRREEARGIEEDGYVLQCHEGINVAVDVQLHFATA